jgi:hypothetical protein
LCRGPIGCADRDRRGTRRDQQTITVVVLGDAAAEGSESFNVLLSNPTGATIVDGSSRGTIVDDEAM